MSRKNSPTSEAINMGIIQSSSTQIHPEDSQRREGDEATSSRSTRIFLESDSNQREDEQENNKISYRDLDELKEVALSMARKKELRLELIKELGKKAGRSKWKSDMTEKWRIFKENSKDGLSQITLWKKSLHQIEGRFGSAIRSYFAFLRWLFILNLYIFFLVFSFVVIPTIVFENLDNSAVLTTIADERNVSAECVYNPYDPNSINSFSQYIIWWFTGQGFMENTLLFSGYYDNIATTDSRVGFYFNYNIPLAFLLVAFFYFLFSLALVVRKATFGWKESLTSDSRVCKYSTKIFCGWDYCINDQKAARLKHTNIKLEINTDLEEDKIKKRQASRTRNEKIILYMKRILINIVIIAVLAGALFAIFFAAQYSLQNTNSFDNDFFLDLLITYLTSIVITVANFIAPLLFDFLIQFEDYSPDLTIRLKLIRTVVLRLASVVFLYVVVYLQIYCNRYELVSTQYNGVCMSCEGVECWETYLGQEMYKLTILDFFIVIAVTLFVEFPRKLIVDHCKCGLSTWVGVQEFDIPGNVLGLVYAQTVGWIGAFYAPLLPVLMIVKFFVFFYLKKLTLLNNCQPSSRPYRASRSGTFFYVILMFGFGVAVFPVGISVSIISPSLDCGPFRGWPTMFYALTSSIMINLPTWAQEMFWFFGSAPFAAVLIVILCIALYYIYSVNSANKATIELLRNQLALEGDDARPLRQRSSHFGQRSRRRH